MVGKVVGKRRKRPLSEPATSDQTSTKQWNTHPGPTALPSPAATESSQTSNIVFDIKLCQNTDLTTYDFTACDQTNFNYWGMPDADVQSVPWTISNGLLTPCVSPPQMPYIPTDNQLHSRSSSSAPAISQPATWQTQPYSPPIPVADDEETTTIKLLAYLKTASLEQQHTFSSIHSLVDRTNKAMIQLLNRPQIQSNYTCQLLFSTILIHLTSFCETMGTLYNLESFNDLEFINESCLTDQSPPTSKELAKISTEEAFTICLYVADLLKRKPLNGYQALGRHESAQIELDIRLRNVLAVFSWAGLAKLFQIVTSIGSWAFLNRWADITLLCISVDLESFTNIDELTNVYHDESQLFDKSTKLSSDTTFYVWYLTYEVGLTFSLPVPDTVGQWSSEYWTFLTLATFISCRFWYLAFDRDSSFSLSWLRRDRHKSS